MVSSEHFLTQHKALIFLSPLWMSHQHSYSIQQSAVGSITTSDYLSQMKSVTLAGCSLCNPSSLGLCYEKFSMSCPHAENMSSVYTNPTETEIGENNDCWLAAQKYAELPLWIPTSHIVALAGIMFSPVSYLNIKRKWCFFLGRRTSPTPKL